MYSLIDPYINPLPISQSTRHVSIIYPTCLHIFIHKYVRFLNVLLNTNVSLLRVTRATFTECARCSFRNFTCIISESFSVLSLYVCMRAQSCLTLCNPMICSPPGSSVYRISQARILEWVVSSSRGSSQSRDQACISCIGRQILYC